jgi:hypothetical protein
VYSATGAGSENRMGYTVKPFDIPLRILPQFFLWDHLAPIRLAKDMDNKILKGHNHILWLKIRNQRRRFGNVLGYSRTASEPAPTPPFFVGHDPFRVPTYVLKRCEVSPILVRPPDDISIFHQINEAFVVSSIRIAPGGFPSSHKLVSTVVLRTKPP